ncbi:MAG TPA: DUF4407 domain-containing protein [Chitinophagaceae bacterium]|jgi:hypothetical protein|nr:DUF4407 domain-containing protein [Chitinophagaceae bacterium]
MTNFINTLPYRITGDSYTVVQQYDANSRRKINTFASVILLTAIIWFITAFMISYSILNNSLLMSLVPASISCIIIFIVERSIVNSQSNSSFVAFFRFGMALAVAVLASTFIDLLVFKSDIDKEIKNKEITHLSNLAQNAKVDVTKSYAVLNNEMSGGPGSSGLPGDGKISNELKKQSLQSVASLAVLQDSLTNTINAIYDPAHPMHQQICERMGINSILYRMIILHELIQTNKAIKGLFWVLFLLGLGIELLPLIVKFTTPKSAYDLDQEAQELVFANRRKQVLQKSNYYTVIGHAGRDADSLINEVVTRKLI